MAGHINHTKLMNSISTIPPVLLSKGMGAQEAHEEMEMLIKTILIRENVKGKISLR
jgi:hypothetical protein